MTPSQREPLLDGFGRVHTNLRISVTDRCNIRCSYCMPEQGATFESQEHILSFDEIERFAKVAVSLGVDKIRLTGGEPLLRRDLPDLVQRLSAIEGVRDLALTTNGVLLSAVAQDLYDAGLRRINLHLDTLDRERFRQVTRRDELPRVLEAIDTCERVGIWPLKINAVAVKGVNEPDIEPLARLGRERGVEIRWIEFMPLDGQHLWNLKHVLTAAEIVRIVSEKVSPLETIPPEDPHAPASEYRYRDGKGAIGVIASVSQPFCKNCNRLRLTADGNLRYCLFALEETPLRQLFRSGASDAELAAVVRATIAKKWAGHEIRSHQFVPPPRPMYAIGG